ncbi:MAG: PLP-dependent aminotransferase family protein [Burkholderiaceae bacterium]
MSTGSIVRRPRAGSPRDWIARIGLDRHGASSLQAQLREAIVRAIAAGTLSPSARMPSTRELAARLAIARNTATLAYRALAADGWLLAAPRAGHVVNPALAARPEPVGWRREAGGGPIDWRARLAHAAGSMPQVAKPRDGLAYPYPFVYGEFDPAMFPLRAWREAARMSLRPQAVRRWASDRIDADDPELVAQIALHLLPRRGIQATPDRILVTLGAQQAMAAVAAALARPALVVGLESPGYPDAWNTWSFFGARTLALPLDDAGLVVSARLAGCRVVQVSPSHQNPTTTTMPQARRRALLRAAVEHDLLIVEDDYDSELAFDGRANAAIKAMDEDDRVIYIGSLSKTLAPGLRLGFLVGAPALVAEARAVRRLMLRHPPANNQRALAHLLAMGHYETLQRRLQRTLAQRAHALSDALERHLPQVRFARPTGGSALWARAPRGTDMDAVARRALARGVVFDPGAVFWRGVARPPREWFRLGYASIPRERIEAGVAELARAFAG